MWRETETSTIIPGMRYGDALNMINRPSANMGGAAGISLNAVLIILLAGLAWRPALRREIPSHGRRALRLLMVVSGVWFFGAGLML